MNRPLPEETRLALEDAHAKNIGLQMAQAEANHRFMDSAYEAAARTAEPPQLYVRRGGAWGKVQNCKLRPGEFVFVVRPTGEYETIGVVNSSGEPPPPEFIP